MGLLVFGQPALQKTLLHYERTTDVIGEYSVVREFERISHGGQS